MLKRCPGARELVEPKITVRTCPACGEEVEFLSYEKRKLITPSRAKELKKIAEMAKTNK